MLRLCMTGDFTTRNVALNNLGELKFALCWLTKTTFCGCLDFSFNLLTVLHEEEKNLKKSRKKEAEHCFCSYIIYCNCFSGVIA